MIAFQDFVPQQLQPPGFFTMGQYALIDQAVQAANEWIRQGGVKVLNVETVVLPNMNNPGEEGTGDAHGANLGRHGKFLVPVRACLVQRRMTTADRLRRRIRGWLWVFIVGLVFSGLTAIPLAWELDLLAHWVTPHGLLWRSGSGASGMACIETYAQAPFHGLWDGLAGVRASDYRPRVCRAAARTRPQPLGNYVRHDCLRLVVPWAMVFGSLRGIPFFWRLIDCSFGVFGIIPLWLCRRDIDRLERMEAQRGMKPCFWRC